MEAIQIDFLGKVPQWNVNYDINIFYNRLTDIIVNTPSTDLNAPKYINAGRLRIAGLEGQADYRHPRFSANASLTYQYAIDASLYYFEDHRVYSVPRLIAAISAQQCLLNKGKHSLWLTGNAKHTSKTINKPNTKAAGSGTFELDAYTLLDLGLKYSFNNTLQLAVECDNVFNKTYYIGGTSYFPYQYPRRVFMTSLAFKL